MTLCFSGHRFYVGADADEKRLTVAVRAAYDDGYRVFISGMAEGFDLAAAEAVVRLRDEHPEVRLVAAVPFEGHYADPRADEIVVLEPKYKRGCYYRRDEWMVDRSTRLICYYDRSKGGTGTRYTVKYALSRGLEIDNIFRAGELF